MLNRSRRSASAVWMTDSNSFERWLISMTDMPVPLKSSISACACWSTSKGNVAGPALKLWTRFGLVMKENSCCEILYTLYRLDLNTDKKKNGFVLFQIVR